jgi:hypothetical protein
VFFDGRSGMQEGDVVVEETQVVVTQSNGGGWGIRVDVYI